MQTDLQWIKTPHSIPVWNLAWFSDLVVSYGKSAKKGQERRLNWLDRNIGVHNNMLKSGISHGEERWCCALVYSSWSGFITMLVSSLIDTPVFQFQMQLVIPSIRNPGFLIYQKLLHVFTHVTQCLWMDLILNLAFTTSLHQIPNFFSYKYSMGTHFYGVQKMSSLMSMINWHFPHIFVVTNLHCCSNSLITTIQFPCPSWESSQNLKCRCCEN